MQVLYVIFFIYIKNTGKKGCQKLPLPGIEPGTGDSLPAFRLGYPCSGHKIATLPTATKGLTGKSPRTLKNGQTTYGISYYIRKQNLLRTLNAPGVQFAIASGVFVLMLEHNLQ